MFRDERGQIDRQRNHTFKQNAAIIVLFPCPRSSHPLANFRLIWSEKKRYYTLILAKRPRSEADLRTCWVKQRNQNHTGFWTNIFWLGHLSFRFIIIEIFGARFWPLWAHLPSVLLTLSYQLSKLHKNVSGRCCRETFSVFTAWSWSTRWRYPTSRMIGHWLTI